MGCLFLCVERPHFKLIGASLSEPLIDELYFRNPYIIMLRMYVVVGVHLGAAYMYIRLYGLRYIFNAETFVCDLF